MNPVSRLFAGAILFALAASATAAPIRVGVFKGTGWRWTASTHTAGRAIDSMLAHPDSAKLGPDLVKPPDGFVTRIFGVVDTPGASTIPTLEQKTAFLDALDSLDVIVLPSNSNFGVIFDQAWQRQKLDRFFMTRGAVSLSWSADRSSSWDGWSFLLGVGLTGWLSVSTRTLHQDSAAAKEPAWRFLNRGLPDTAQLYDEWEAFNKNSDDIRAVPGLKVTMKVDSASSTSRGNITLCAYSWYREFPEGGRFFYTGNGYHASNFTGTSTNFFRRQLYNAILWAAGADSTGTVSIRGSAFRKASGFSDAARVSSHGEMLAVSVLRDGAHAIEVRGLDGRLAAIPHASRRGEGPAEHVFANLRPGAVYVIAVTTLDGRVTRLVTAP